MRKLVLFASLSAALVVASGCIITSSDGDDPTGAFDVAWTTGAGCPAGATTAQVLAFDAADRPFEDLFDCEAGGGVMRDLPLGSYDVTVNITDQSTNGVFAITEVIAADLLIDGDVVQLDFDFTGLENAAPTNQGFFGITWTLVDDGVPSQALSCADAGADGVSMLATLADTTTATDEIFDCVDGSGSTTVDLTLGEYVVDVSILDGEDVLGSADPKDANLYIGDALVDLGNFEFVFPAL